MNNYNVFCNNNTEIILYTLTQKRTNIFQTLGMGIQLPFSNKILNILPTLKFNQISAYEHHSSSTLVFFLL